MRKKKIQFMSQAISSINDGDKVAIGGSLIRRHPMAAIHEIIRQKKKKLTIYGWNNAIDFDLLIGSGCIKEAHSSYVGLAYAGQARNFRRGVENEDIRFVDHSETTAIDKFRAGASGLSFIPSKTPLNSSLMTNKEYQKTIKCPFTEQEYIAMQSFTPDVSIVHAHKADIYGNVQLDEKRMMDNETDVLIAKSAKYVIVTVEQIVSEESIIDKANDTVLPRIFVDAVVEAPYGAHPTSCDTRYDFDIDHLQEYSELSKTWQGTQQYIKEFITETQDWGGYLEKIGVEKWMQLTRS